MAGRKFSSSEIVYAQDYIVSSLIKSNVQPFKSKFRHPFKHNSFFSKKAGNNIIGYVKGIKTPEQYIVLTAHYDHLGTKGSKVYNGADDNASGISALLAFSQKISIKPLNHSVIFLFTDGEEVNLLGAKAFINQQKQLLSQIRLNINIDMIAGSKGTSKLHYIENRLETILPIDKFNDLKSLSTNSVIRLTRGFKRGIYKSNNRVTWINASDHGAFNHKRIPFIYFGVDVHNNYHTINDNFENINLSFYIHACELTFKYLLFFDENIIPLEHKT